MAEQKTNAMRLAEQAGVSFTAHSYPWDGKTAPDGATVAKMLGLDPGQVFKTLVAKGASGGYFVFEVPVEETLDLKKAAKAVGEKSIEMLPLKELFPLTGYVHGGCSPIGMKKPFPTVFDETSILYDTIYISAGKIGLQIEAAPGDLMTLTGGVTADITVQK